MSEPEWRCPTCGHEADVDTDCPGYSGTWNGKETVMVCSPPCGNAMRYFCLSETCDWWYRDPPGRRSTTGMGVKPAWALMVTP